MVEQRVTVTAIQVENPGRKVKGWIRDVARSEAEYHGKKHIPKHFQSGAATRYGYERRSTAYVRRARRRNPSWKPLVFTGQLKAAITTNQSVRVTSTKGATLVMLGPDYKANTTLINGKPTGLRSLRIRMKKNQRFLSSQQRRILATKEEITAMTADELTAIGQHGQKTWDRIVTKNIKTARRLKLA